MSYTYADVNIAYSDPTIVHQYNQLNNKDFVDHVVIKQQDKELDKSKSKSDDKHKTIDKKKSKSKTYVQDLDTIVEEIDNSKKDKYKTYNQSKERKSKSDDKHKTIGKYKKKEENQTKTKYKSRVERMLRDEKDDGEAQGITQDKLKRAEWLASGDKKSKKGRVSIANIQDIKDILAEYNINDISLRSEKHRKMIEDESIVQMLLSFGNGLLYKSFILSPDEKRILYSTDKADKRKYTLLDIMFTISKLGNKTSAKVKKLFLDKNAKITLAKLSTSHDKAYLLKSTISEILKKIYLAKDKKQLDKAQQKEAKQKLGIIFLTCINEILMNNKDSIFENLHEETMVKLSKNQKELKELRKDYEQRLYQAISAISYLLHNAGWLPDKINGKKLKPYDTSISGEEVYKIRVKPYLKVAKQYLDSKQDKTKKIKAPGKIKNSIKDDPIQDLTNLYDYYYANYTFTYNPSQAQVKILSAMKQISKDIDQEIKDINSSNIDKKSKQYKVIKKQLEDIEEQKDNFVKKNNKITKLYSKIYNKSQSNEQYRKSITKESQKYSKEKQIIFEKGIFVTKNDIRKVEDQYIHVQDKMKKFKSKLSALTYSKIKSNTISSNKNSNTTDFDTLAKLHQDTMTSWGVKEGNEYYDGDDMVLSCEVIIEAAKQEIDKALNTTSEKEFNLKKNEIQKTLDEAAAEINLLTSDMTKIRTIYNEISKKHKGNSSDKKLDTMLLKVKNLLPDKEGVNELKEKLQKQQERFNKLKFNQVKSNIQEGVINTSEKILISKEEKNIDMTETDYNVKRDVIKTGPAIKIKSKEKQNDAQEEGVFDQ